jgi:hypothetical protein
VTYKQLKKKWYSKLAASGFKDIEDENGMLKEWSSSKKGSSSKLYKESKAEYYRLASQYLWDKQFSCLEDKIIWSYHCSGMSLVDVAKTVRKSKGSVQYAIERMRREFFK